MPNLSLNYCGFLTENYPSFYLRDSLSLDLTRGLAIRDSSHRNGISTINPDSLYHIHEPNVQQYANLKDWGSSQEKTSYYTLACNGGIILCIAEVIIRWGFGRNPSLLLNRGTDSRMSLTPLFPHATIFRRGWRVFFLTVFIWWKRRRTWLRKKITLNADKTSQMIIMIAVHRKDM